MNPDATSLDRLHDLVTPPATPWWPPAPGWYWVLGALAAGLLAGAALGLRHWLRNRYRHEALKEMTRLEPELEGGTRRAEALTALAVLLKRTALSAWPREKVAGLTGAEWQTFLNRSTGGSPSEGELVGTLESAAYDPKGVAAMTEGQMREVVTLAKHWLRHHRVSATQAEEGGC